MKLKFKYVLLFAVGVLFAFLSYKIVMLLEHKKRVAMTIQTMPAFSYQSISGHEFSNKNLQKNAPTVFFYFNTECEFCNGEAEQVKERIEVFKNIQLVFISFEKQDKIKAFAQKYKLEHYDNVFFVADSMLTFSSTFDVKSLPAIVVYNKDNQLVKKCKGPTKPERIAEMALSVQ